MVPKKGDHSFTKTQVMNLEEIHERGGAVGVGMVICGKRAVFAYHHQINSEGQINWNELWNNQQGIKDIEDMKHTLEVW